MGGPSTPTPPDPSAAAVAGGLADTSNFPFQYIINSLAETGGNANIGGTNYDFTGLGNADQSNQVSDQMAQTLLDIQNNYGSAYITQRLADLKQSDPAGYAARQQLFDQIQQSAQQNPDRPLADDLQTQINNTLQTSGQLDAEGKNEVSQGIRAQQSDNGITLGNAATSQEADAQVQAADQLQNQQQGTALSYLESGTSPQDVAYRRIQQSLSNLGAFSNNQTPEAEFGSLSGAQNGAAPVNEVNYSSPASINTGSSVTGLNFANSLFGQQSGAALQQSNPWLAGLTLGTSGIGAANQLGAFNSLTQTPPTLTNADQTQVGSSAFDPSTGFDG